MSTASKPPCPYCASADNVIKKGKRANKHVSVQIFLCKSCIKRFTENRAKTTDLPEDTAEIYLFHAESLNSVLKTKNLSLSRTTLYRRIMEQARDCPDWDELVKAVKGQSSWGFVMGIDTTGLKIRGANFIYLHTADVLSGDPLAYAVCRREDVATIEPILRQLRNLGYRPQIVVSDLAPELLVSVRHVFPNAKLQGCIFHLISWLDKELPTKKSIKKVGKEKFVLWRKVKNIIKCAAIAKNEFTRNQYLEQLKRLEMDETAESVVKRFLGNLKYYHTMDEFKDYPTTILYNNLCERHIGMIKNLKRKMRGFKSVNAAQNILKFFWFLKRKDSISFPEKDKDLLAYYMPLASFYDGVNLTELSKASGISREALNATVQKIGREVVGDYAFTGDKLGEIHNNFLKIAEPTTLAAVMRKIEYDQTTTKELLEKFGFRILFKSFDPSDIIISPAGHGWNSGKTFSLKAKKGHEWNSLKKASIME